MKPRLLILSDLWGSEKIEWLSLYVNLLSVKYEVKIYSSCLLAGIPKVSISEEERHLFFVDGGIDNAVNELLKLEKEKVTILAFSIGGAIGWKAILKGLRVVELVAVSSTRLRYEVEKVLCKTKLYYGELDEFKPSEIWFKKMSGIRVQVIPGKAHDVYKEIETMKNVCLTLLR